MRQVIADVVEAIIGAAYITDGDKGAFKAIEALNIPIPGIETWAINARRLLEPSRGYQPLLRPETISAVEAIMGVHIKRPHFLEQALVSGTFSGY
jgi:endoribonuclease Dicer